MVVIPFPGTGRTSKPKEIGYADTAIITFTAGGSLTHNNAKAFIKGTPSGYFAAYTVIFSSPTASSEQTVTLTFTGDDGKTYSFDLTVTANPKLASPPSSPKKKK